MQKFCSAKCGNAGKKTPWLKNFQFEKGHVSLTSFKKGQNQGINNSQWKGDAASYVAKHIWVTRHYGRPKKCELCLAENRSMYHWANISGEYKRDRKDWKRMCVPCHKRYDLDRKQSSH